ncbi:uncharacterized protein Dwil_GK23929 [Drosophila willistoni]|uniref:VWA7 Ig-like domain-containing protein n=1 Tax=Drosophila willistoni TaxID=7260 RepID=B4MTY4_DROWI|nr:uncharacterized protein LOC6641551 isoform X2 [Drosophila willistoni]EDW75573.1 uncharacterized protein Dwil_GK23929 [Drosophila willistoni]
MILRSQICLGILLMGLLLSRKVGATLMDEDYGGGGGGDGGGGGGSYQMEGSSDDIYQPTQMESDIEAEHKQHINDLGEDDVSPSVTTEKPQPSGFQTASPDIDEENSAKEVMDDAPTRKKEIKTEIPKSSSEYYDEEPHELEQSSTTSRPPTTLIPEYVRKAKAERFPHKPQNETNNSDLEYVEDEGEGVTQRVEQPMETIYEDEIEPQQANDQQLPSRQEPQIFKASSDEFYYDDIREDQDKKHKRIHFTAPVTTEGPLPILRARFGGFPWPTTLAPSTSTSTTPTTTSTSTSTTTTTTTTTTTPIPPRKQPKHIHVGGSKNELLPADQLRNYIKDVYIRMPLAVIVDPSAASLEQAKRLYIDALQEKNINIKIVLVTLNAAGAPSAFSFNNTQEFIAGLNSTKEHEGGNAFVGVLHAAELVPYDSAVFISTAAIPPHTELVQDAAITLLKKRIRLFLLWYGERSASENETDEAVGGILGEVAIRSGGEIIHIVSTEHGQHIAGNTLTLVADAYQGVQELDLPVDTTLSSLHVRIDAKMRRATMETPNGEINLKKLVKFGTPSNTTDELDAYIPLNKLRKATNFKLKLQPENEEQLFNIFIRAERKADVFLGEIIKRIDSYYKNAPPSMGSSQKLRLAKLQFPADTKEKLEPKSEVETFSETEIENKPSLNQSELAASTGGQQRSSLNAMLLQRCGTKIELSTQSQLLITAGQLATLHFEVTNMRSERVYLNVQVTDERRFLVQLQPTSFYVQPLQTTTVRLQVLAPVGTTMGTTDRVTFTTYGRETATMAVNLKVVSIIDALDTTGPTLSWEYGNRCDYVAADSLNCGERFWTVDVTAQDWQSGMMRLQAQPSEGLFYRNYYTAGTTEPLKASYMASCCEPKVALTAFDAAGNQRSINLDVRDVVLTEAGIAAICLGVILLLLLLVAIICGIVWCCRRRKITLDMPTYRSHSTRSME